MAAGNDRDELDLDVTARRVPGDKRWDKWCACCTTPLDKVETLVVMGDRICLACDAKWGRGFFNYLMSQPVSFGRPASFDIGPASWPKVSQRPPTED